jgi:DNA-binding NtrC family response regulator
VKGAFTDARSEKMGLFEYAQSGTLFLDEVGSLSASAQAKLLKILEDKKLRKVGDVNEKDINVRVVAATNLDLEKAIEAGNFREDLYFRLNLLVIRIPPLRERKEDLSALTEHYLHFYSILYNYPDITISDSALDAMQQHSWPGNVRELCNVIERAVLLSKGDIIEVKDVETAFKKGRLTIQDRRQITIDLPPQGLSLSEIEQCVIKQVLNACNWNKTEAAKLLKISRPRLRRILENAGVDQNRRQG